MRCSCTDHSHDLGDDGGVSLIESVDIDSVRCLNEQVHGSCKTIIKHYQERDTTEPYMESNEDDTEMIMHVPFSEGVRLTQLSVTGHMGGTAPSSVKLWANRDDIDFSNAEDLPAAQTIELVDPDEHTGFEGNLDYPLRGSKFNNLTHLTMFFSDNFGADNTRINYVGFKGARTNTRHGVVECVYEARAVPGDHQKVKGESSGGVI
ncbi:hypothetical protein TrCOL_g1831 [Triparma columacea]|uniref:PITH domain-containing protein n=1 Tax=Triparma columacea TaxID=722753 RepID=A0A9W7FZU8_9STRA|nr:hypothetical protein TrCOL_g1831 [Triparma columacea]